jgi:nitrile hydratase accessory protein
MDQNSHLDQLPGLPQNEGGPLFAEPWQLTAFGIVLALHRNGYFQWREWVNYISEEIELGKTYGLDPEDHNGIYYHQWLAALEKLVTDKKLSSFEELIARKEEWRYVDEHRGFGEPLNLHGHHHHAAYDDRHAHTHSHHHHHDDHGDDHSCRPPAQRLA